MSTEYRLVSVDRITDDVVLCEDDTRQPYKLLRKQLSVAVREGDCLRLYKDGRIEVDAEQTEIRRERIRMLQNRLFGEE